MNTQKRQKFTQPTASYCRCELLFLCCDCHYTYYLLFLLSPLQLFLWMLLFVVTALFSTMGIPSAGLFKV